jgi:hypothetical protein
MATKQVVARTVGSRCPEDATQPDRLGIRNAEVAAYFSRQRIGDFGMSGYSRTPIIRWISPPRMAPAFADQHATMPPKMSE